LFFGCREIESNLLLAQQRLNQQHFEFPNTDLQPEISSVMLNRNEKRGCKLHAAFKSAELEGMNIEKMIGSLLKTDMNSVVYFNVKFKH
jgi:hypothetical protein